jgi:predicted nucleic acid-binding Zn ribbon protein
MTEVKASYIPGVCNINYEEIAQRRKAGHLGLAIFVVVFIVLLFVNVSHLYRVVLFLPALLGAIGYLQARNHFCVGYAGAGLENATEGSKKASAIADKEALAKDKKKARSINAQAVLIAAIITVIAVLIPHI